MLDYGGHFKIMSKGNLIKIIIGAILIVIFGIGITLATRIWNPLWNSFRPVPEKVIVKMATEIEKIKTYHLDMDFQIDVKGTKVKLNMQIETDLTEPENPKTRSDVKATIIGELELFSDFKNIEIGETSYIKAKALPIPLELEELILIISGIDLKKIKDEWIKIELASFIKIYNKILEKGEISKEEILEIREKIKGDRKKEEELYKKLIELIKDKKTFRIKEVLPDEKINNIDTYHLKIELLNKNEVKGELKEYLIKELKEILTEEELKEFQKQFEQLELSGELWIGKKNYLPYKIRTEIITEVASFKWNINLSNFNQMVKIEPPEKFKELEEILPLLIISPSINILSSIKGEMWKAGEVYEIKWETQDFSSAAKVQIGLLNLRYTRYTPKNILI